MKNFKVCIDEKNCAKCNLCGEVAPGIIESDLAAAVLNPDADLNDPKIQEKIKDAVKACPNQIISISSP